MLNTLETCRCAKCYTLINSGFEKRPLPCVLQAGVIGRQTRIAYAFFDTGNRGCSDLCSAALCVYVRGAQMGNSRETVCVHPVLPCGAPLPVEERVSFEVGRNFCGWKAVDILPLIGAVGRELGDAPFGLTLSVSTPSLIMFSAAPRTGPRLALDWQGLLDSSCAHSDCPCADAVDICAPVSCGRCAGGSGVRVESQVWDIEFEGEDSSVVRRVDRIKEGTFFVTNSGGDDMLTTVETSSDASCWAYDTQKSITPGETQAIVAKFYGRYYRLMLNAPGAGKASVEFIGQYYT